MKRKLLGLLLAAAMTAGLTGCAGNGGATEQAAAPAAEQTKADSADSSEAGDSSEAPSGDTIKIGFYGPLTGASSVVGVEGQKAVQLAIKEANEAGGVNGRQLELISYDDAQNTETSVKVVTRLVESDKVTAIIGSHISGSILATVDISEAAKVVQVGSGTSPIWTNIGLKYTFRGTACSDQFNIDCYKSMETMGATKIATLAGETEYAQTAAATIHDLVEEGGKMEVVAQENFTTGDTDFSGQIVKIIAAGADGVYVVGGSEDMGKIVKQLRQKGYEGYIYGIEPFGAPDAKSVAGDAFDDIVFSCCYFVPDSVEEASSDIEKEFLEKFVAEFGALPTSEVAYRDYDGTNILIEAMRSAGSLDGDSIREAILNLKYTGIGGDFDFSADNGEGLSTGNTFIAIEGKVQVLDEYLKNK
ncbi:MAG: ABC transporter substrate-binding protein [Clostridium sp.]|nr:ABC transporter substrate-binding protein [Clostridium sp.]